LSFVDKTYQGKNGEKCVSSINSSFFLLKSSPNLIWYQNFGKENLGVSNYPFIIFGSKFIGLAKFEKTNCHKFN
jgi:hypothetical protein